MYSMAMDLVDTDLNSLLWPADTTPSALSNARMLQHFQSAASLTLGCSMVRGVMQSFVTSDAWEHPYLMHMVLAVSVSFILTVQANVLRYLVLIKNTSTMSTAPNAVAWLWHRQSTGKEASSFIDSIWPL